MQYPLPLSKLASRDDETRLVQIWVFHILQQCWKVSSSIRSYQLSLIDINEEYKKPALHCLWLWGNLLDNLYILYFFREHFKCCSGLLPIWDFLIIGSQMPRLLAITTFSLSFFQLTLVCYSSGFLFCIDEWESLFYLCKNKWNQSLSFMHYLVLSKNTHE